MHGNIFGHRHVSASDIDQHADFRAAVNVVIQGAFCGNANETTDRDVLPNLADQRLAGFFHARAVDRHCRQRRHVSRILGCNQFGQFCRQSEKVVVLGHEIGFAVHFHDCAEFLVAGDVNGDDTFSRHATGRFAGFVTQLYAQNFFCFLLVTARFSQRFFAFHHWRVSLLAQFLDHCCRNLCHFRFLFC